MTSSEHVLDLSPLLPVSDVISRLVDQGWDITDGLGTVQAHLSGTPDPRAALASLADLTSAAINVEVVGVRDGARLCLRLINGLLEVVEPLVGNPNELFDEAAPRADALRALDGDANAALRLPMVWNVQASFAFNKMLIVPDATLVTVTSKVDSAIAQVLLASVVNVGDLLNRAGARVLVALELAESAQFGSVTLTGLEGEGLNQLKMRALAPLPGEQSDLPWPPPVALLGDRGQNFPEIFRAPADHLRGLAAQLVWRTLATSEQVEDGDTLTLTFHGYRKAMFSMPPSGTWQTRHIDETLALREWAFYDASPDRLLAVRQVTSLYQPIDAPFAHAGDIQASAEIVYAGLRSAAVAEAMKSARDAHNRAQESARQTSKNATDMLKNATERMFAVLGGVGAVFIANAGRVLPDDVGRLLIVLVAVFLLLLAAASVFLEGPLLALSPGNFKADIDHEAGLLTDEQRDRIQRLPSLVAVRRRIAVVRWAVPLTHVAFAAALFLFAHPDRYVAA